MAIPSKTLDEWVKRAIANFRTSFPGLPLGTKKFLGRNARAIGNLGWQLNKAVEDVSKDIAPTAQSSDDALSQWAEELGLPDGAGGYGRLKPVAATGGVATLTGVKGTIFPNGTTATAEDGTTQISLSGAVTISGTPPGFGSVTGQFVAVTAGTVGNLPVGTVCTWDSPPAGADSTFTITSALAGGEDDETNAAVFVRITDRLQTPPRGGVEEDYRLWTAETDGITGWVYPKRSGTGTVDVVITQNGTGTGRVPSSAQKAAVETILAAKRPADIEGINVLLPHTTTGHDVKIKIVPSSSKYNFDWNDTATSYTVDTGGYSAGPPATLRLNTLAPASLKSAIDGYLAGTNLAPRLQVISTGSVVNVAIRAVAYVDAGGKTTLTLETVPTSWVAPSSGDKVFAYGPAVATIATNALALCDALGPSRLSGFGDPNTPWNDTLTISGLIGVAESATDTDGTPFVKEVPVSGATIDGSVVDIEGDDSAGAPELLFLKSVAVVQG